MSQGQGGGAPLGNKNRVALKDEEIRQQAYQEYCDHLAKGKSKKSWFFNHPQFRCTWETMEKYIQDEVEFDPFKKKSAEALGLAYWEGIVADSAAGKNTKANTATLQMLMRNKYGWDKPTKDNDEQTAVLVQKFDNIMSQVTRLQYEAINKAITDQSNVD